MSYLLRHEYRLKNSVSIHSVVGATGIDICFARLRAMSKSWQFGSSLFRQARCTGS
jgi:hypothetical protein